MNRARLYAGTFTWLCVALPCHAGGLDLGWDACATDGGRQDTILPCASIGTTGLYGTFQLDNTVDQFVALDFSLDLQTRSSPSGDFWNFGIGECNEGTLIVGHGRFAECLSALPTMCSITGSQCQNGWVWGTQFSGPNRHRLVGSIFRDSTQPVALTAGTNYFAFKLEIFTVNAVEGGGTCVGCGDGGGIVWNSAVAAGFATDAAEEAQDEPIEGPGLVDNCVDFNGARLCGYVPTQNTTWGQIKSLYR